MQSYNHTWEAMNGPESIDIMFTYKLGLELARSKQLLSNTFNNRSWKPLWNHATTFCKRLFVILLCHIGDGTSEDLTWNVKGVQGVTWYLHWTITICPTLTGENWFGGNHLLYLIHLEIHLVNTAKYVVFFWDFSETLSNYSQISTKIIYGK